MFNNALLALISVFALAEGFDVDTFFNSPTSEGLEATKDQCRSNSFQEDTKQWITNHAGNNPTTLGVRALVFMRNNCSDGSFMEDLDGVLGDEILLKNPEILIEGLAKEGGNKILLGIAYASGQSGVGPFIDCDKKCLPKIEQYYKKKTDILKKVNVKDNSQKAIKDGLLSSIPKALNKWKKKLK
jgi:hypothetical protein